MADIEYRISKNELTGRPVVKGVVPRGTKRDTLNRVQDILFTDIIKQIGLEAHPGCLSGIDGFLIEEQYEQVIKVSL